MVKRRKNGRHKKSEKKILGFLSVKRAKFGIIVLMLGALVFFIGDLFTGIVKDLFDLYLPPTSSLVARIILFAIILLITGVIYADLDKTKWRRGHD